jgi:hypothetical protein
MKVDECVVHVVHCYGREVALAVRENGQITLTEHGNVLYENPPPEPEPTFMVVDVRTRTGPRYFYKKGGCATWNITPPSETDGGISYEYAASVLRGGGGLVICPCRKGTRWIVVGLIRGVFSIASLSIEPHLHKGFRCIDLKSVCKHENAYRHHIHDLETAITERDAILALNDRKLSDVHIACIDMMREGGAG